MLGGGFDATQAFVGDLANFHIWDRKLSIGEIYNLATCSSKAQIGNVFSWLESSIDIYGGASKWTFEACRQLNWTAGKSEKPMRNACVKASVDNTSDLIDKEAFISVNDIWICYRYMCGHLLDFYLSKIRLWPSCSSWIFQLDSFGIWLDASKRFVQLAGLLSHGLQRNWHIQASISPQRSADADSTPRQRTT